jgi:hypothetical protein
MLHDLLEVDLTAVDLRQAPETEALFEQKLRSMPPAERWWFEILNNGRLLPSHGRWETEVRRDLLHDEFAKATQRERTRGNATELGLFLARILPPGYPRDKQKQVSDLEHFMKPTRKRHWILPSLSECRHAFGLAMRVTISWPTIEDD